LTAAHFSAAKIPVSIITGFLGAGKTTLIRSLLEQTHGRRIALIINEFGELGVDGGLLRGCGLASCADDDVVELSNGCICCTVAEDFIPAMTKLLARSPAPDHIIIETSGLALPQPLVAAFNWPAIKTRVTVDSVITVADGPALAEGRFADDLNAVARQRQSDSNLDHETPLAELFADQIQAADLIILNKADALSAEQLAQAEAAIAAVNRRGAPVLPAGFGNIGADILLGRQMASEADIENRPSGHEHHHHDHDDHDDHGHDHEDEHHHGHHEHDDFVHFAVETGEVADIQAFAAALKAIIRRHNILRLKGFAAVKAKPMRCVVQAAGQRVETYFDRPWPAAAPRRTALAVIGLRGLDCAGAKAEIAAAAAAAG